MKKQKMLNNYKCRQLMLKLLKDLLNNNLLSNPIKVTAVFKSKKLENKLKIDRQHKKLFKL